MPMKKYPTYVNGLVRYSRDPEDYFCHICYEKTEDTYKNHLKSIKHQLIYDHYKNSFIDNNNPFVTCKLCYKFIGHKCIRKHAIVHKLIPWYRPENEIIILANNFVSKHDNEYYCHICGIKLAFWYLAIPHCDEEQHRSLLKLKTNDVENESNFTAAFLEFIISNFIFPKSEKSSICVLCDKDIEFNIRHIAENSHISNEKEFLNDFKRMPQYLPKPSKDTNSSNSLLHKNKVEIKEKKVISSCELCNCLINEESIDEHKITSKIHKKKEGKYLNTSYGPRMKKRKIDPIDLIYCDYCERSIDVYNIYFHNKTTEHLVNFSKSFDPNSSATDCDNSARELVKNLINNLLTKRDDRRVNELPKEIIALDHGNFFLCTICNSQICGRQNILEHVDSVKHEENKVKDGELKKNIYGCIINGRKAIISASNARKVELHSEEVRKLIDMIPLIK